MKYASENDWPALSSVVRPPVIFFVSSDTRTWARATMVARAQVRVSLDTKKITGGRTTEESAGQSFSLAYFMMLILYISLLLYGVQVMGSVIEEKTSRVIEVLVSSLRPFQLLLGKLLGVGA